VNPTLFSAFLLITAVLIIAPGPIVTLVISTGATQGVRAALTTVAGTTAGNILLLAAIAVGLNWVVAHAGLLFEALRWTGAAYLIWLGVQAWRRAGRTGEALEDTGRQRFFRGLVVALSNPKTIVFFTAFLPQFIDPRLPAGPQLAAMCAASALMAAVTDSGWAVAAGLGRAWLMKPARAKLLQRLTGGVLIGGGIWLTLARRPS
jgi:threonine/homoserine/homoserine lactone efflux protein